MTKRQVATLVMASLQKADQAIQRAVWALQLASFQEYSAFSEQLTVMLKTPHERVYVLATHYLGKLEIGNPGHAEAIQDLAEAIGVAGMLAKAYRPGDEKRESEN